MIEDFPTYKEKFIACVYTRLGGLDMAKSFFAAHRELRRKMMTDCRYHFDKGGAYWKGAAIFYDDRLAPVLKDDRQK